MFHGFGGPAPGGNAERHELDERMMVALSAMVSGAGTCVDMALFGRSKAALLRLFFRRLDPVAFEACLARHVAALAERTGGGGRGRRQGRAAAVRSTRWPGPAALDPPPLTMAVADGTGLVLGQRRVDGKSNEISDLPEPSAFRTRDGRSLVGCGVAAKLHGVTADPTHCRRANTEAIVARGSDHARIGSAMPRGRAPAVSAETRHHELVSCRRLRLQSRSSPRIHEHGLPGSRRPCGPHARARRRVVPQRPRGRWSQPLPSCGGGVSRTRYPHRPSAIRPPRRGADPTFRWGVGRLASPHVFSCSAQLPPTGEGIERKRLSNRCRSSREPTRSAGRPACGVATDGALPWD